MSFDAYSVGTNSNNDSNRPKVDFDALNNYVIETAACQEPETLTGVISVIVDLGSQKQPDAEYDLQGEDVGKTAAELTEKYAQEIAEGKISKFDKSYDSVAKSWVIRKFVPQKDRQSIAYAVDFPDIQLDKGQFFGDDSGETKPLRLWSGGQFWNKYQKKMLIQNLTPLKITKDDKVGWTMKSNSLPYKMAVASKVTKQGDAFLPQEIDKLLGKTMQFKVQIYNEQGKDGKQYYKEKMSFVGGLGRGQKEIELDKTYLIQFNKDNDPEALKELRKHIINTIENATNFEGSAIQAQLLEARPHTFKKNDETPTTPKVNTTVTNDDLDDDLPF